MLHSPSHSTAGGMLSPPQQNYNSTGPGGSAPGTLDWGEPVSSFLFPNITTGLNQTESMEDVEELLPDLITDDELEEINLIAENMGLNDGM